MRGETPETCTTAKGCSSKMIPIETPTFLVIIIFLFAQRVSHYFYISSFTCVVALFNFCYFVCFYGFVCIFPLLKHLWVEVDIFSFSFFSLPIFRIKPFHPF